MSIELNNNAVLYATYVSLYVNDIACNAIKEIKPYINRKDKKALNWWRKLDKCVSLYFINHRKIVRMDGLYLLANYNEVIDEFADKPLTQINTAIKYTLRRLNVEDSGIIYKTMVAHILMEFSISMIESLCESLRAGNLPYKPLLKWRLLKTQRAMQELYFKVCKNISNDVIKEIQSIIAPIISLLTSAVSDNDNFERAFKYAVKEEQRQYNERTNNE